MVLQLALEEVISRINPQAVTALQVCDKYQHIDLNQFYVAVERLDKPGLVDKPVVIVHRAIVSAASYEAKALGIRPGIPYFQARGIATARKAGLARLKEDMRKYLAYSHAFIGIVGEVNPEIEIAGSDEVTCRYTQADWREVEEKGRMIMARVRSELGLTVSVGNSFSPYVAKMCSKHFKPNKMTTCHNFEEYAELFGMRSVDDLHGVGEATTTKLGKLGINTIEQLVVAEFQQLRAVFGSHAAGFLIAAANGAAYGGFKPWYEQVLIEQKGVSRSILIPYDRRGSLEAVTEAVRQTVSMVCERLQEKNYQGRTVEVAVRHFAGGGTNRSAQHTLGFFTDSQTVIERESIKLAQELYQKVGDGAPTINLVSVRVSGFK